MKILNLVCGSCGTEFQKENYPSWKPPRYCSTKCAGAAKRDRAERKGRDMRRMPGHPLAAADGRVLAYRVAMYDSVGPGPQPCFWCGTEIHWGGRRKGCIHVDHLDGDFQNDELANLVVSCTRCNNLRGLLNGWVEATGRSPMEMLR